jgi:hypothetical protein
MKRIAVAISLALPGVALAMAAKPFVLGDFALFMGIVLAFTLPIAWLVGTPPAR